MSYNTTNKEFLNFMLFDNYGFSSDRVCFFSQEVSGNPAVKVYDRSHAKYQDNNIARNKC